MFHQYGSSYFSILATDKQRAEIHNTCDNLGSIAEDIQEYKVYEDDDISYYLILICISDCWKKGEELCDFILHNFPYIAIRQEESTYIIVKDKEEFKTAILKIYKKKENKIYFLFDMLTLNERYALIKQYMDSDNTLDGLQFIHTDDNGNVYKLNLSPDTVHLYRSDSYFEITNIFTNEIINVDIADYINNLFTFHIAIFEDKILKKTR